MWPRGLESTMAGRGRRDHHRATFEGVARPFCTDQAPDHSYVMRHRARAWHGLIFHARACSPELHF